MPIIQIPTLTNQQIEQFHAFTHTDPKTAYPFKFPCIIWPIAQEFFFTPPPIWGWFVPGSCSMGILPRQGEDVPMISLKPVMKPTTYIAHLRSLQPGEIVGYNALFRTRRPSQIAVLPIGYTHGFPRHLTGTGHVLLKGKQAPIIGKICMDMMMVDVTRIFRIRLLGMRWCYWGVKETRK